MANLITQYLTNCTFGITKKELENAINNMDEENNCGFWISYKFYKCISSLFTVEDKMPILSSRSKSCYEVHNRFNIQENNIWSCKNCLRHCLDNINNNVKFIKK